MILHAKILYAGCSILSYFLWESESEYDMLSSYYYDLRKFSFTNRVIPIWNSLPNQVVCAETVNSFKNRLDKFWSDQEELYDYKSDLHGIVNRSILV